MDAPLSAPTPSAASWIERTVARLIARPGLAIAATLLCIGVCAALGSRLQLTDDTGALVKRSAPAIFAQFQAAADFSPLGSLVLDLDATDSSLDPASLDDAAVRLAEALRSGGGFSDVRASIELSQLVAVADAVAEVRFLADPREVTALSDDELRAALSATREQLLSPQGFLNKSLLLRDPLGSVAAALARLGKAPGLEGLDTASGRLASRDGRHRLILTTPDGDPLAAAAAAATMEKIDVAVRTWAASAPGVVVRPIGAHRFANESQQVVRADVQLNIVSSLIAVLFLCMVFFRSVRVALVALGPLVTGAAAGAAVAGLLSEPLHPIVLAFSAACLGMSVDCTVHLLGAVAEGRRQRPDASLAEILPAATAQMTRSILLVAGTTVAGLVVLAFSDVDALRQMAVLASACIIGSFAGNLVWVPIILPRLAPKALRQKSFAGPWQNLATLSYKRPWAALLGGLAVALATAAFLPRLAIDGDLRNLDHRSDAATADLAAFAGAFGSPDDAALAVAAGVNLDEALERAVGAEASLATLGVDESFSPAAFLPPKRLAQEKSRVLCGGAEQLVGKIRRLAVELEFSAEAFAPFEKDLAAHCAAPAGVDPKAARQLLAAFASLWGRPLYKEDAEGFRLALAYRIPRDQLDDAHAVLRALPGVLPADPGELSRQVVLLIGRELPRLALWALGLVTLLLLGVYRDVRRLTAALVPCVLGMLGTLALFAALSIPVNLMTLCVFPLLAGVSIDYGIVMADGGDDLPMMRERSFSVTVAAFTALGDFGTMTLADYPALFSIGRAVVIAVGLSWILALCLSPALVRLLPGRRAAPGAARG